MRILLITLVLTAAAGPAFAARGEVTLWTMFMDATVPVKLLMLGLIGSTIAAIIICCTKIFGSQPTGGSAFISGLRVGGPLAGLLGAVFGALNVFIAMAMSGNSHLASMAPGMAESLLSLLVGLLAGTVAIIAHSLVNSRIDRALLKN